MLVRGWPTAESKKSRCSWFSGLRFFGVSADSVDTDAWVVEVVEIGRIMGRLRTAIGLAARVLKGRASDLVGAIAIEQLANRQEA